MEEWQKKIVIAKMSALIDNMKVSYKFLSYFMPILSKEDFSEINAENETGRIFRLLTFLPSRVNSYNVLLTALEKTKQTGALKILQKAQRQLNRTGVIGSNASIDSLLDGETALPDDSQDVIFRKCVAGLERYISTKSNIRLILISTIDAHLTVAKLRNTFSLTHCNHILIKKITLWGNMKRLQRRMKNLLCIQPGDENLVCILYDKRDDYQEDAITKEVKQCINRLGSISTTKQFIIVAPSATSTLKNYCAKQHESIKAKATVIQDKFNWGQLTKPTQNKLLARQVSDHGRLVSLQMVCNSVCHSVNDEDLFMRNVLKDQLLVDLMNYRDPPVLFNLTIPAITEGYTERTLICRNHISVDIFQFQPESEVFVFSGLDSLEELKTLAGRNSKQVDAAKNQVSESAKSMARFILVEDELDFETIWENAAEANITVHRIHVDNEILCWRETRGNDMEILQQNILDSCKQHKFKEEHLYEECGESSFAQKAIIICDSPITGIGKSLLLASLANKARGGSEREPIVLFFSAATFFAAVKRKMDSLDNAAGEPETKQLITVLQEETLSAASPYPLDANILWKSSVLGPKVHIFFDDLDQVSQTNLSFAFDCLKHIKENFDGVKIYVTAKENLFYELERLFGVLGYTVDPLDAE